MDEEQVSLTNPKVSKERSTLTLYIWWGLNVAIVIFVFLAFLFSALTYARSKHLEKTVNNTIVEQQGGRIAQTYKVSTNFSVSKGLGVSFCATNQVCNGLGPEWGTSFFGTGSATPAVMASFAQLTPALNVYVHVADADHTVIRVSIVDTSATPRTRGFATLATTATVTALEAKATSNAKIAAIFYSSHDSAYLVAATVSDDSSAVTLATPIPLFTVNTTEGALRTDLTQAGDWTLITYGYEGEGAQYLAYAIDTSAPTKFRKITLTNNQFVVIALDTLASAYLGNGWIIQGNANSFKFGKIDFATNKIDNLANAPHPNNIYFHTLTITSAFENYVVFTGVQVVGVDVPLTLTFIVEWFDHAPFLTVFAASNLLGTQDHQLLRDQVSVCYLPPYPQEPYGGLFFAYVDSNTLRAKILRARTAVFNGQLQLLPSPSVDISTVQYGKYGGWLSPLLSCPTVSNHLLIVIQDAYSVFNTFTWNGGFRYAGIAQSGAGQGKDVVIVRSGISSGHEGLVSGFHYWMFNNGTIAPYTSIAELFTPNGFRYRIGTALSDSQLYLSDDIFDVQYSSTPVSKR